MTPAPLSELMSGPVLSPQQTLDHPQVAALEILQAAAQQGVRICNSSATEPLVILKHFGPGNPEAIRER